MTSRRPSQLWKHFYGLPHVLWSESKEAQDLPGQYSCQEPDLGPPKCGRVLHQAIFSVAPVIVPIALDSSQSKRELFLWTVLVFTVTLDLARAASLSHPGTAKQMCHSVQTSSSSSQRKDYSEQVQTRPDQLNDF